MVGYLSNRLIKADKLTCYSQNFAGFASRIVVIVDPGANKIDRYNLIHILKAILIMFILFSS